MELTYQTHQENLDIYLIGNLERLDTQIDKNKLYQTALNPSINNIVIHAAGTAYCEGQFLPGACQLVICIRAAFAG